MLVGPEEALAFVSVDEEVAVAEEVGCTRFGLEGREAVGVVGVEGFAAGCFDRAETIFGSGGGAVMLDMEVPFHVFCVVDGVGVVA